MSGVEIAGVLVSARGWRTAWRSLVMRHMSGSLLTTRRSPDRRRSCVHRFLSRRLTELLGEIIREQTKQDSTGRDRRDGEAPAQAHNSGALISALRTSPYCLVTPGATRIPGRASAAPATPFCPATLDTGTVPTPPTTASPDQADPSATDPAEVFPEEDPEAEPAPEAVEVPTLVGMTLTKAKQALAGRPWAQGDDQVQVHRPIPRRDRDLAVSPGPHWSSWGRMLAACSRDVWSPAAT
jgi:hypothetical protein